MRLLILTLSLLVAQVSLAKNQKMPTDGKYCSASEIAAVDRLMNLDPTTCFRSLENAIRLTESAGTTLEFSGWFLGFPPTGVCQYGTTARGSVRVTKPGQSPLDLEITAGVDFFDDSGRCYHDRISLDFN